MKILVCLISAQHVPNLLAVHAVRPDKLILLVSDKMVDPARWLIKALAFGGLDYGMICEQLRIDKTDSIAHTKSILQEAYEKYPGSEWVVNLTGGTKPMSMAAYEFFRARGSKMLYVSEADQSIAIDFSGGSPLNLNHEISIQEFLAGYGFDLLNPKSLGGGDTRAEKWFELAAMMAADQEDASLRGFLGYMQKLSEEKNGRDRGMNLRADDRASIRKIELREKVSDLFGLEVNAVNGVISGSLDKYAVRFFTGGWLEVFIWGVLRRFNGDGIWDLRMGISFGKKGRPYNKLENEWDIAFMREQSLNIVECKTGEQAQDPSGSDTLYKIEAIKEQLGAIRVRSYLATTAPNVVDTKTGVLKDHIATRAHLYGCKIVTRDVIRQLAELHLSEDDGLDQHIADIFDIKPEASP